MTPTEKNPATTNPTATNLPGSTPIAANPAATSPIAAIRKEYKRQSLSEQDILSDPIGQFEKWWNEALQSQIDEVNAMTLSTASAAGEPDARIVLLKGFDKTGFTFFTNYNSAKGHELLENPHACLVFFWKELERQIRIKGPVEKLEPRESDDYFSSRPAGSRIGAWSSPQSQLIESREWLEQQEKERLEEFRGKEILRPPHWGGYRLTPHTIEFWQGRPNRLHDRILYTIGGKGDWKIGRLAP
ncbi:MAG: pyridoxamine 5'-phosphate oxidase [Puia sp.]|nr:pyridoxamine 5'-phosphate oxidase [Puia sp.]